MKLYATVASERASKGQGGNKFLDIDIQSGDERGHKLRITLEHSEIGTLDSRVSFVSADSLATLYNLQAMTREAIREMKGERQKGDNDLTVINCKEHGKAICNHGKI